MTSKFKSIEHAIFLIKFKIWKWLFLFFLNHAINYCCRDILFYSFTIIQWISMDLIRLRDIDVKHNLACFVFTRISVTKNPWLRRDLRRNLIKLTREYC